MSDRDPVEIGHALGKMDAMWNRRRFLAAGLGGAGVVLGSGSLAGFIWPFMAREDLLPGAAPTIRLTPHAWTDTPDSVRLAVLGDNGSGGRQAMAVADRMAHTYVRSPFGHVVLLGDICYYGSLAKRFDDVFHRPFKPLIDAGVGFELAIGNHDDAIRRSTASIEEIQEELRALGTPGLYYSTRHGPVDLFMIDSSVPGLRGPAADEQLAWLDAALASARGRWRIVAMHHPAYSSGLHGSSRDVREVVVPILERHRVDLALAGHDHDYERTHPIEGISYVVSGGGCKRTPVGTSSFTARSASALEFVLLDINGDRLTGTAIAPDGKAIDRFVLRARR